MAVTTECKEDIVSNKGNILFTKGLKYKGELREGKGKAYILKDNTGCLQTIPDDKFFKTHFKVMDGME